MINKITLKELIKPMLRAYGVALVCIILYFVGVFGLFQGWAGLAILPLIAISMIIFPVIILTICIKIFLSPRFSFTSSLIIATLSLILGFLLSSLLPNILSNSIQNLIFVFGAAYGIAYLTGLFLAVQITKHVGKQIFFVILAIVLIAIAGTVIWQYTHPTERRSLASFTSDDRKDIAEATRLAADLPAHREQVLDPDMPTGLVPTYPPETKIILDQETWKSDAYTDPMDNDYYQKAYYGSAYADIQPSGQRVVIRFVRNSGKWYIGEVSDKPRQD
jgi:hypothetical protein